MCLAPMPQSTEQTLSGITGVFRCSMPNVFGSLIRGALIVLDGSGSNAPGMHAHVEARIGHLEGELLAGLQLIDAVYDEGVDGDCAAYEGGQAVLCIHPTPALLLAHVHHHLQDTARFNGLQDQCRQE